MLADACRRSLTEMTQWSTLQFSYYCVFICLFIASISSRKKQQVRCTIELAREVVYDWDLVCVTGRRCVRTAERGDGGELFTVRIIIACRRNRTGMFELYQRLDRRSLFYGFFFARRVYSVAAVNSFPPVLRVLRGQEDTSGIRFQAKKRENTHVQQTADNSNGMGRCRTAFIFIFLFCVKVYYGWFRFIYDEYLNYLIDDFIGKRINSNDNSAVSSVLFLVDVFNDLVYVCVCLQKKKLLLFIGMYIIYMLAWIQCRFHALF